METKKQNMYNADMKKDLTIERLQKEARHFSKQVSNHDDPSLFGATDGKAVGTYLKHRFKNFLAQNYTFDSGNSASGIDFPGLLVDIKTTSITQPQSSCPFKSARQKLFGLDYALLVFVYQKEDDTQNKTSRLNILHTIFVEADRTADYQLTLSIRHILENNANKDDIVALFSDKNLPVDDITAEKLAEEVLANSPKQGYLTISNALQWRLQYSRIISEADAVPGIHRLV